VEQLESLVPAPAAEGDARLVYCDVGSPAAARIVLVPRWLLVLLASGLPLLLGLVVSLRKQFQNWLVPPLVVAFIAGMAIVPLATLTVLQAAVPGLLLAAIAALANWWRMAKPVGTLLQTEVVSGDDRRPDSVTRAAPDESLVINTKTPAAQAAAEIAPRRSVAES
jgi:hypothetical protein